MPLWPTLETNEHGQAQVEDQRSTRLTRKKQPPQLSFPGATEIRPLELFGRGLDHLYFKGDGHLFSDSNPTGFEYLVPDQAEILAIDFGAGRGAASYIAPRVLALLRRSFNIQRHLAGYTVQRQVSSDFERVLAGPHHFL